MISLEFSHYCVFPRWRVERIESCFQHSPICLFRSNSPSGEVKQNSVFFYALKQAAVFMREKPNVMESFFKTVTEKKVLEQRMSRCMTGPSKNL